MEVEADEEEEGGSWRLVGSEFDGEYDFRNYAINMKVQKNKENGGLH